MLEMLLLTLAVQAGKPAPKPFVTPLTMAEMSGQQAVIETDAGTIVLDLRPDLAPNHVGYFITLAREGSLNGTTFHRVLKMGIVQGGDPYTKDPKRAKEYGTGGLGVLKAEFNREPTSRGAVAAVLVPDRPDSAGSQFFICVTDQPLDGKYTVFARVAEGMDVVEQISMTPADAQNRALERVEIKSVTIRDAPPPAVEPFSTATVDELQGYRAVLETSAGPITIGFFPERAPEHVRNFLRLAASGVFDGMAFHRVVKGFAVQTGSLHTRGPLAEKQQKLVRTLQPEFNDTKHTRGIVSMARGDDPASASTSFFIVTGDAPSLDGKYTVFGQVVEGLEALAAIEHAPVNGEEPVGRIELRRVSVVK